jgi:hypothetical protein
MMGTRFLCFAGGHRAFALTQLQTGSGHLLTPAAGPVGSQVDGRARAEAAEPDVRALTTHGAIPLKRTLSAISLVTPGIGATVGAGIVV